MNGVNWKFLIEALPSGLTFTEAARRLGQPYQTVRRAIAKFGYAAIDGRKFSQNSKRHLDPKAVDWTLSNIAIARQYSVSKQRISIIRKYLGLPLVESRGRPRKNNDHHTRIARAPSRGPRIGVDKKQPVHNKHHRARQRA